MMVLTGSVFVHKRERERDTCVNLNSVCVCVQCNRGEHSKLLICYLVKFFSVIQNK